MNKLLNQQETPRESGDSHWESITTNSLENAKTFPVTLTTSVMAITMQKCVAWGAASKCHMKNSL